LEEILFILLLKEKLLADSIESLVSKSLFSNQEFQIEIDSRAN